jgi:hypothetical protein
MTKEQILDLIFEYKQLLNLGEVYTETQLDQLEDLTFQLDQLCSQYKVGSIDELVKVIS